MEKDLHYFITRIINPDLNWIVVGLHSDHKIVYGRDGYTGVAWRDKTPSDYIADRLEEWRDNLWYKYKQDFPSNGKAILEEYFKILLDAELAFYDSDNSAVRGMWELAESMGEYLDLSEYVSKKREEVKIKAAEIRGVDRYIKERAHEHTYSPPAPLKGYERSYVVAKGVPIPTGRVESVLVKIKKSRIKRPGKLYVGEDGFACLVVTGTSLRAYVPVERLRIYEKNGEKVVEIDKISDDDIKSWELHQSMLPRACRSLSSADLPEPTLPLSEKSKKPKENWFKKFFRRFV